MECLRQILKFHANKFDGVNYLILNHLSFQICICSTQQMYHRKTRCSPLQHRLQKAEFWIANRSNSNFKLDFQFFLCKLDQQSTETLIHFNTVDGKPTIKSSRLPMDLNNDPTKQAQAPYKCFLLENTDKVAEITNNLFSPYWSDKRLRRKPKQVRIGLRATIFRTR